MDQKLSQKQLEQIVAGVQQLSLRQEAELDRDQVREILRELNLPPELLEEAMVQLSRREALKAQKGRNFWIIGGVVGAIALVIFGSMILTRQQEQILSSVNVQSDRLTLAQDTGGNLNIIDRQTNQEIFYRVTLANAPLGQKLSLSCNWIDPNMI